MAKKPAHDGKPEKESPADRFKKMEAAARDLWETKIGWKPLSKEARRAMIETAYHDFLMVAKRHRLTDNEIRLCEASARNWISSGYYGGDVSDDSSWWVWVWRWAAQEDDLRKTRVGGYLPYGVAPAAWDSLTLDYFLGWCDRYFGDGHSTRGVVALADFIPASVGRKIVSTPPAQGSGPLAPTVSPVESEAPDAMVKTGTPTTPPAVSPDVATEACHAADAPPARRWADLTLRFDADLLKADVLGKDGRHTGVTVSRESLNVGPKDWEVLTMIARGNGDVRAKRRDAVAPIQNSASQSMTRLNKALKRLLGMGSNGIERGKFLFRVELQEALDRGRELQRLIAEGVRDRKEDDSATLGGDLEDADD